MSWQAITFGLLGLVLVGGFAWYERSRPPARMVALVAALAALAVAGRLAFAAIPNVVATTDIVLFTGYALGAAPGFAVGGLAALVSNMWLGQGPWTPWEMAGWGLVGIGGAALAPVTGRRLGRVGLALACGLAGLAYGALLDLSVMVSYGGEQSLDRYLTISARGVPFNLAHAGGNVALALAAGPVLVRMISRYRQRFAFSWPRSPAGRARLSGAATGPLALLALVALLAMPAASARAGGPAAARAWLEAAQKGDGGFGFGPGQRSSPAMTGWAMLGLEGAGRNPLDLSRGGRTPVDFLRAHASHLHSAGDVERTVLALAGAGVSPRKFGGHDLVAELRERRSGDGSFQGQVNLTAYGILALRASGESQRSLARSARWIRGAQDGDGGWGFQPGAPSDPDSTGAALQGLAAAGTRGQAAARGVRYLRRAQLGDGGFALAGSSSSNSQSTAWAVQGLVAARVKPAGVRRRGRSPLDYLAARQDADGHYRYSAGSDQTPVWVTAQALLAVERRAFPLPPVPRSPGAAPPSSQSRSSGSEGGAGPAGTGGGGGGGRGSRSGQGGEGGHAGPSHPSRPTPTPPHDAAVRFREAAGSSPATPAQPASGGGSHTALYVAGGLGLLAAALSGGFLLYRRRLP